MSPDGPQMAPDDPSTEAHKCLQFVPTSGCASLMRPKHRPCASPRTFFVGHAATSPKDAVSLARVCPPCWSEPPPPTITAGSGTRQSGRAHWESNRTLARFSVVHVTAAIVGKDAKVGQQSVNAVLEKALHARASTHCFDDQLVGIRLSLIHI